MLGILLPADHPLPCAHPCYKHHNMKSLPCMAAPASIVHHLPTVCSLLTAEAPVRPEVSWPVPCKHIVRGTVDMDYGIYHGE